jgi:hypothetical protein
MKYCIYLQKYVTKSNYPYYIVEADEDLTHFHVWSKRKTFNATIYTEQKVLDLINEKYPNSTRYEKVFNPRKIKP